MVKEVIRTEKFLSKLKKIDKSYLERLEKLIIKIVSDPDIGKPMKYNRKGTREVYLSPFRLSYAYDKFKDILFFLDIYHKNEQ
jgi:mRNA-degrading endonuclease RelE of RelBE toxin-antitoxin system